MKGRGGNIKNSNSLIIHSDRVTTTMVAAHPDINKITLIMWLSGRYHSYAQIALLIATLMVSPFVAAALFCSASVCLASFALPVISLYASFGVFQAD